VVVVVTSAVGVVSAMIGVVVVVALSKALQLLVFGIGPLGDEAVEFF